MACFVSVLTIMSLVLTSMQKVTSVVKENVTLQDEGDVKSIIGAFYDGFCFRDDNCLRPLSYCDESKGTTQI